VSSARLITLGRAPSRPMHLLFAPDRKPTPKLRGFIDFVVATWLRRESRQSAEARQRGSRASAFSKANDGYTRSIAASRYPPPRRLLISMKTLANWVRTAKNGKLDRVGQHQKAQTDIEAAATSD